MKGLCKHPWSQFVAPAFIIFSTPLKKHLAIAFCLLLLLGGCTKHEAGPTLPGYTIGGKSMLACYVNGKPMIAEHKSDLLI